MPKTIVLLLDGTSNTISDKRTNVLRLYGCLRKSPDQLVYYDPGVGTLGAQRSWSQVVQDGAEIWGMATGWGIDTNVKEAYRFLVENYDDGQASGGGRDRICLFGFSRGAYTARMLAGFIHAVGLMARRNLNLLDHAWRAYKRVGADDEAQDLAELRLYERILATDKPPIHLLGLFDTVASVIEPGPGLLPQLKHHAFTVTNPSVAHVRHAVALDERRRFYAPLLWPEGNGHRPDRARPETEVVQDVREVWFAGSHTDVGGGSPEAEAALAKIPLLWMIDETAALGLDYETATVDLIARGAGPGQRYVAPDALAPVNGSMRLGWQIMEQIPLPAPGAWLVRTQARPRAVPPGARVHAAALARVGRPGLEPAVLPASPRIEGNPADWPPPMR